MNNKKQNVSRDVFGRDLSYLLSCHPGMEQLNKVDLYSYDYESGYTPMHICLRLGYLNKAFELHQRWKTQQAQFSASTESIWDLKDREGLTPLALYQCENDVWGYEMVPARLYPARLANKDTTGCLSAIQWEPRFKKKDLKTSLRQGTIQELGEAINRFRGGRELFTTGSNVHLQLGTGDSDDRQELYKVNEYSLEPGNSCEKSRFRTAIMKRYHSVLVTTSGDVFTAGSGSRGRLGNGDTNASNVSHTKVDLGTNAVNLIDSSDHHSVVLTEAGDIYCWGWNRYSQLGFSTPANNTKKLDNSALENICSAKPKRVVNNPWRKTMDQGVSLVACSKVHTCLLDDNNNLYSWGLNLGQMGSSKNHGEDFDALYNGYKGWIVSTPLLTKLPSYVRNVRQLFCTEFATVLLFDDNQLCVMNNYRIFRFTIPKPTSKQQISTNRFEVFTPTSLSKNNRILKIKSAHQFGNNMSFLYENGAIGILQSKIIEDSAHGWSRLPNALPITQYWVPFYSWNKCLDFDVGVKGQIVICTNGGAVFRCETSNAPRFIQQRSSKLISGKCVIVSCDSLFSSFGLIKDDVDMIPLGFAKQDLYHDLAVMSPLVGSLNDKGRRKQKEDLKSKSDDKFIFENFSKASKQNSRRLKAFLDGDDERSYGLSTKGDRLWETFVLRWAKTEAQNDSLLPSGESHSKIHVFDKQSVFDNQYDVLFTDIKTGEIVGGCHFALLRARAPLFINQLIKFGHFTSKVDDSINFTLKTDSSLVSGMTIIEVDSERVSVDVIVYALHYLYTDEIPDLSSVSDLQERKALENTIKKFLKLFDLHLSSFRGDQLPFAVGKLLTNPSSNQSNFFDVEIRLAHNEVLYAHSFILKNRCAFFESALSNEWIDFHHDMKTITLDTFSKDEFGCVLRYIYGFSFATLLTGLEFNTYKDYVDFVLGLLQLCNQISLDDLKHYLESTLIDYIDASTVLVILINAYRLSSKALALECCWFIHNNIGLLFTDSNSELIRTYFDSDLWSMLQDFVSATRLMNNRTFESWYSDEGNSMYLIQLFQSNLTKFNEGFMDPEKKFDVNFESRPQSKKQAASKKNSERRKSSTARKVSFSRDDITNIRRKSSSTGEDSMGTTFNTSFFGRPGESAVDEDISEDPGDEFVTVIKSKRKMSKSKLPQANADTAPFAAVVNNPNKARFESTSKAENSKQEPMVTVPQRSQTNHAAMFPVLSSAIVSSASSDESKGSGSPFSAARKLSQKERIKSLAAAENKPSPQTEKKQVWGSGSNKGSKAASSGGNSSSIKFPSLAQALQDQPPKKRAPTKGLMSTGDSSVIPLYLSGTPKPPEKPSRTLKETIEEERFAKWWAEESKKVQQQLIMQEKAERQLLSNVYQAEGVTRKQRSKKQKPRKSGTGTC